MRGRLLAALALAAPLFGMPTYYTDLFTSWNGTAWQANGAITAGGNRLTSSDPAGATAMSLVQPASDNYEIVTALSLLQSGGRYTILARASADARYGTISAGSFYAIDFSNVVMSGTTGTATMTTVKRVNGIITQVSQTPVSMRDEMEIRVLVRPGGSQGFMFSVTLDGRHMYYGEGDAALASGKPGLGVAGAPAVNGFNHVFLYNFESTPPPLVPASTVATSIFSTSVDLQWKGVSDGNGSGLWKYNIYRDGQYLRSTQTPVITDNTLSPSTTYKYIIVAMDYHLNSAQGPEMLVRTPAAGSFDPRRTGVKPNGAYWGGAGENIDMQSANLNYTIPLLTARGRGQTSVTLQLSYNSQNWRKDELVSSIWKLAGDIGYGFGWRLQAGSVTPYFSDWWNVHHWVYTDATGAQYRLDQQPGGIYTSNEGIYVTFDGVTGKLRFNDGTWWSCAALSSGAEDDAGTYYPTLIQDSNGNQVVLSYEKGVGMGWANSSGRISRIQDPATAYDAFTFIYENVGTQGRPHLTSIKGRDGVQSFGFTFADQTLSAPFGTLTEQSMLLTKITDAKSSQFTALEYNPSGEMKKLTLPYGAMLEWEYANFTFANSKTYREVSSRYLTPTAGATRWTYDMRNDPNDPGRQIHYYRAVLDYEAGAIKLWYFDTNAAQATAGLASDFQDRKIDWSVVSNKQLGWVLDSGSIYLAWVNTTRDGMTTRVEQTRNGYGNLTQQKIFDTDLNPANARVYNYTYATFGASTYIRNRLASATYTAGGQTYTLAQNSYDGYPGAWLQDTWAANPYAVRLHDSTYDVNYTARGNVTSAWKRGDAAATLYYYDLGGSVIRTTGGGGPQVDSTLNAGSSFILPSVVTPNNEANLSTSMQWDSLLRLTSVSGPSGVTTIGSYDPASRPTSMTSKFGAVTTYTYSNSAPQVTATVNGRWTKTYYDGLGRTVRVEAGAGATAQSIVETVYAPCACSPMGKVSKVSLPYAPGGTVYWTEYVYDKLGRTIEVKHPNGSGSTLYEYGSAVIGTAPNTYTVSTVKTTDPAGKWKIMAMDGFGNLILVAEPNPADPTNLNLNQAWTTSYAYNVFNQLTTVTMPRPTGTQTRTFVYNTAGQLTSVTQPETGTTTYGYDASGRPSWKRDAKQQLTELSYDAYNRTTQILRYKRVPGADVLDPAQKTVYSYDSAVNGWGRLGSISTYQHFGDLTGATPIVESFAYTVAGLVSQKTLNVTGTSAVSVSYEWDNEGRPVVQKYPDMATGNPSLDTGPRFTWGYDSMGRLATMGQTGPWGGFANTLVSSTTYNAAGQMTQLVRPGGTENRTYNELGQLIKQDGLGRTVEYSYNATANDGRITKRKELSGEEVDYQYDALGRLISAATTATTGWGLNFTYDGFGNKTGQTAKPGWTGSGTVPQPTFTVDWATNRLGGFGYL